MLAYDPIYQSVPSEKAKQRLQAKFDIGITEEKWALGFRFDIVLRGPEQTPMED